MYGHSLGSVLSYDILCHQEILSSPFPMEFMYTKHEKEDEPSENNFNLSSEFNSRDDGTRTAQESLGDNKSEVHHVPTMLDDVNTEDQLPVNLFPASSSIREESSMVGRVSAMQGGTNSSAADGQDQFCSPGDACPVVMGTLAESSDINCDTNEDLKDNNSDNVVYPDVSENVAEVLHTLETSDKDEDIPALKSEVCANIFSA